MQDRALTVEIHHKLVEHGFEPMHDPLVFNTRGVEATVPCHNVFVCPAMHINVFDAITLLFQGNGASHGRL